MKIKQGRYSESDVDLVEGLVFVGKRNRVATHQMNILS